METSTAQNAQNVSVVTVFGRLDALQASSLRQELQSHIDQGTVRIVVDLVAADFVDSAGLAALVRAMKQVRAGGGDLRIVAPTSPEAMRVFELTRFDKVFEFSSTLDGALSDW